jgi:hypothetical protein
VENGEISTTIGIELYLMNCGDIDVWNGLLKNSQINFLVFTKTEVKTAEISPKSHENNKIPFRQKKLKSIQYKKVNKFTLKFPFVSFILNLYLIKQPGVEKTVCLLEKFYDLIINEHAATSFATFTEKSSHPWL